MGTRYGYSNLGVDLAGYILQVRAGVPYTQYVQQKVLDPLGMSDSTLDVKRIRANPTRAIGHTVGNPFRLPVDFLIIPSGGVWTTAEDMVRYLQFHINKGALDGTRLLFVSFDAEESGLRGSRAWVKAHRADLQSLPTRALNIDSTPNGIHDADKFDEHAVTGSLHDTAAMLGDFGINQFLVELLVADSGHVVVDHLAIFFLEGRLANFADLVERFPDVAGVRGFALRGGVDVLVEFLDRFIDSLAILFLDLRNRGGSLRVVPQSGKQVDGAVPGAEAEARGQKDECNRSHKLSSVHLTSRN